MCKTEVAETGAHRPISRHTWPPFPTDCQQCNPREHNGTHVVTKYIYDCKADYAFSCRLSARLDGVDDSCEELRQSANKQADGKEDTSTADVSDDGTVEYDSENTDSRENTRVLEAVADICHLEEICAIS